MYPLEIKNIYKSFYQGGQYLMVLKGANYILEPGKIAGLIGPSGSGKSTFLEIVGLLNKPDSGDVIINGISTANANDEVITKLRGKSIGFVYQFHHLLAEFSALENVMIQGLINGQSRKLATEYAGHVLNLLKLGSKFNNLPSQLSGGEQQRVAIARALVKLPSLILADEPTGNLDPDNAAAVLDIFLSVARELKIAALIVTHNEKLAAQMDEIVTITDGKITNI
ncbi:MAG: ABC transporter ATP-binding protein [Rickettsiales bacterium]